MTVRCRPALNALLVAATAGGLVLGAAAPGSAGGADRKTYKASATSSGSVATSVGRLELADYLSGQYWDRIIGSAARSESVTVTVAGVERTCKDAGISLYGAGVNWANVQDGTTQGGRLRLSCTYPDGTQHRFYWGTTTNGDGTFTTTNCLQLTRTDTARTTTYTVSTPSGCTAQDEVVDNTANRVSSQDGLSMPFSATFTVGGLVPVAK